MQLQTVLAYSAVAVVAIVSPGPATILAIRNGTAFGLRAVVWSALGNVSGLFCLSFASMLGLGMLLASSALLFGAVKFVGAMYLFYLGLRQLFGRTSALGAEAHLTSQTGAPTARRLYQEALLTAATNPKPILFFTALFPQFIDAHAPLAAQFLILTGIFGALSFVSLISYALVASRARSLLSRPRLARWIDRCFGAIFIAFGAALLTLRRQAN